MFIDKFGGWVFNGWFILFLSTLSNLITCQSNVLHEGLPHVNECNLCSHCIVNGSKPVIPPLSEAPKPPTNNHTEFAAMIRRSDSMIHKDKLPNCTQCWGCNVILTNITGQEIRFGDASFKHGLGATNGWLFFLNIPGHDERYIIKVYCIPFSKVHGRRLPCHASVYVSRMRVMMAMSLLSDKCGVADMNPKVWVAPIDAVIPGVGYHVNWHVLWQQEARGITLHALYMLHRTKQTLSLYMEKLNKTQVLCGTVMDLLTGQCDRHSENIFIDQNGQLMYIDNDRAFGVVNSCGADSMLLPGTRYHNRLRVLYEEFYKRLEESKRDVCQGPVDPRVVIDYRCFVDGGVMGFNYPPSIRRCMKEIASTSIESLILEYGFYDRKAAAILHRRAKDMLTRGFEWTLRHGPPQSALKFRMKMQPPCCSVKRQGSYVVCSTCWKPIMDYQLPVNETIGDEPMQIDAAPFRLQNVPDS